MQEHAISPSVRSFLFSRRKSSTDSNSSPLGPRPNAAAADSQYRANELGMTGPNKAVLNPAAHSMPPLPPPVPVTVIHEQSPRRIVLSPLSSLEVPSEESEDDCHERQDTVEPVVDSFTSLPSTLWSGLSYLAVHLLVFWGVGQMPP